MITFFLPRANDICFLGCLRSLKEEKVEVICGLYKWNNKQRNFFSNKSKYLLNKILLPNPATQEKNFISKILKLRKKNKKIFYLPTSDTNMMVAINNWKKISKNFYIFGNKYFSKPNKSVFCKMSMFKKLVNNKIKTPDTCSFTKKNFFAMKKKYSELIVKPKFKDYSQSFYKNNNFKAIEISKLFEFNNLKKKNKNLIKSLIIQQKINFNNINQELPIYVYVNKNHEIIFSICGVKHFIYPDKFGSAGILGITENKEILNLAKKIVKIIKWRGILMIEFIYDIKEKSWKVIEINGRPWLMIDFFRRLGFSFLKLLIIDFLNLDMKNVLKEFEKNKKFHIKKRSIHVDLSILQNAIDYDPENLKKIKKILKKNKNISISALDNNDKKPFFVEKKYINNNLINLIKY